jgi:hypothetical protein
MEKNEIKKELYKQKPMATLNFIRKGVAHYSTILNDENGIDSTSVHFEVPIEDMGDADFFAHMDAKLLIRYLT